MLQEILLILDRDGVLIHNNQSKKGGPYYATAVEDVEFIKDAIGALQLLDRQFRLVIGLMTFQNSISKKIATIKDVANVNRYIEDTLRTYCLHIANTNVAWGLKGEDKGAARISQISNLIYHTSLLTNQLIKPANTWVIDDSLYGIIAAKVLNIRSIHIQNKYAEAVESEPENSRSASDLLAAVRLIIEEETNEQRY